MFPPTGDYSFYSEIQPPDVSADKFRVEQRKEVRKAIAARVKFYWTDSKGERLVTIGMLEDISPSGARMRTRQSLETGCHLDVLWLGKDFSGTVRYCKPSGMDYILGIQKDTPSKS
jgi:hypothetical protein